MSATDNQPQVQSALDAGLAAVPFSQEAEEAVIGAVLMNPDVFLSVSAYLLPDDFYILRNGYIWEAMKRISGRNELIDYLVVQEELENQGRLKEIGGPAYLTHLMNSTPTSMHAEVYGHLVERAAVRRRLLLATDNIKSEALDEDKSINVVLGNAAKQIMGVTLRSNGDEANVYQDAISRFFDTTERLMTQESPLLGIPTGFRDLDDLLSGLVKGDLGIIAARPAMGKTSLMMSLALNAARLGQRVGIFSLEMGREQLIQRMTALEAGIDLQNLRRGALNERQWTKFVEATGRLSQLSISLDDRVGLTPEQVRLKAMRWANETGLDLILLDYIGKMTGGPAYGNPEYRTREVGYFAQSLKNLAREMNIPVYVAAQLNRDLENRKDKRPTPPDLRESGDLEQEADVIMFIYRDVVYNPDTEFPNAAEIIVAKHRNGPTGTILLHFEKSLTKFSDSRTQTIDLSAVLDDLEL